MEEGQGGRMQRVGLVGEQMSSRWGRNVEVRMGGRRGVRRAMFSAVAMSVMKTLFILSRINHCTRRCEQCFIIYKPLTLCLS